MWGQDPLGTEPWGTKTQLPHCLCYISPNVQSKLDPALWKSKGREGCGYTPGSLFFLWDFNCSMNLARDGDSLTLKARTLRHCSLPPSSESLIFVKLHSSCLSDLWRAWAMAMPTCMPLKLDYPPNIREQTKLAVYMLLPDKFFQEAGLPEALCHGERMAIPFQPGACYS